MPKFADVVEYRAIDVHHQAPADDGRPGNNVTAAESARVLFRFVTGLLDYMDWPRDRRAFGQFSGGGDNVRTTVKLTIPEGRASEFAFEIMSDGETDTGSRRWNILVGKSKKRLQYAPDTDTRIIINQLGSRIAVTAEYEFLDAMYEQASSVVFDEFLTT